MENTPKLDAVAAEQDFTDITVIGFSNLQIAAETEARKRLGIGGRFPYPTYVSFGLGKGKWHKCSSLEEVFGKLFSMSIREQRNSFFDLGA